MTEQMKMLGKKDFWSKVGKSTTKGLCIAAKATVRASVVTAKVTIDTSKAVGKEFSEQYKSL